MDDDLSQFHVPGSDRVHYIPNFVTPDEEAYLIRKIQETPHAQWRQLANRRLQTWGGDLLPKNVLVPRPLPAFVTSYPDIVPRIVRTGAFASSPHKAPNHIIMNEYLPNQGIMPHEDGPAYHPVVATLSLGSSAIMHYYAYAPDPDLDAPPDSLPNPDADLGPEDDPRPRAADPTRARAVSQESVLSLLLEPRSLVITSSALYTGHLHGIDALAVDAFVPSDTNADGEGNEGREGGGGESECRVANACMLGDASLRAGGSLERETRYSLTCRDVARVAAVAGVFGRKGGVR